MLSKSEVNDPLSCGTGTVAIDPLTRPPPAP